MKVYFASDHAGFKLKETLKDFVRDELGYATEDVGAHALDPSDDYPDYVAAAARALLQDHGSFAVILGGSGQGEAMVANRFGGVRAAVYYGPAGEQTDADNNTIDIVRSTRMHNNANVLALGARFLSDNEAKEAVRAWLTTEFSGEERHKRRLHKLDTVNNN